VKVKIAGYSEKTKIIGEIVPQGYFNVPHNKIETENDYYLNKQAGIKFLLLNIKLK
jgi:hypothetical protein